MKRLSITLGFIFLLEILHPALTIDSCFECCQYPMKSPEFDKCCKERDCSPDCNNVISKAGTFALRESCSESSKCCLYRFLSDEFNQCCSRFGCCPLCSREPHGCSYGSQLYGWGDVTAFFPEVCLQLKCGAIVRNVAPYIKPFIVPYFLPPKQCKPKPCCRPENKYCLDKMGVVHKEGDELYDDTTCELSRCKSGAVKSKPAKAMCPPPPSDLNCRLIKGGCCPRYDCQNEIRCPASDSFDIVCITNYDQCLIDDDCQKNQICCPVGGCGNNCINLCIDDSGKAHGVGETWQDPDDPCTTHTCLGDGTTATASYGCLDCSTNPSSCIWARPEGECCGGWNCSNPFADLDKADDPNCVYAVTLS